MDGTATTGGSSWRSELRGLLRLALPVIAVQLGTRAMNTVDVVMIGHWSEDAMAAASVGNAWMWFVTMFGIGLLMGTDPLFSQAVGARDDAAISRTMQRGLVLAGVLVVPAMVCIWQVDVVLGWTEQPPNVAAGATEYARIVSLGTLPVLVAQLSRVALQAHSRMRSMVIALVLANVFNAFANWVLIFGNLGAPALGLEGSAWATTVSRWFVAVLILGGSWGVLGRHVMSFRVRELRERALRLDPLRRLLWLGLPIAIMVSLELGVFAATTLTIGKLGAVAVAGHQVALDLASITFMVPMGLGFAGAVRVGNAVGRDDMTAARRSAWVALGLTAVIMLASAALFLGLPDLLAGLYTPKLEVVAAAAALLPVAGIFQVADGLQTVASGVLRGIGILRAPMVINIIGFWVVAFPFGLYLCFERDLGALGMWWGLLTGLVAVAIMLLVVARVKFAQNHARISVE